MGTEGIGRRALTPGAGRLRTAGAAALVACFLLLAFRHVDGQDATYDEGFYFGVGRTLLRGGAWDGVVLLHPPLHYYVASLPLLAMGAEASVHDPRQLLLCRLSSLLVFAVPLLLVVRAWAQQLYGPSAGLVALALAVFSPTLLAHAPLITPDTALAATGLLTLYLYWRAGPDGRVWPWGIALGATLLTKVSAVLFVAALVLLELRRARARGLPRAFRRLLAALALAWLVLNIGYGFSGLLDARGKAAMLAKVPPPPPSSRFPTCAASAGRPTSAWTADPPTCWERCRRRAGGTTTSSPSR